MATQDAFARLMGTKNASNVTIGQDLSGAGAKVSTAMNMGSSGADADHGLTAYNHGTGAISSKQMRLKAIVTEAFDALTNATFVLRQGSDDPLTADLVTLYTVTHVLAAIDAINDVVIDIPLPEITDQFIDIQVTHTGSNPTVGRVAAWIQLSGARGHGLQ